MKFISILLIPLCAVMFLGITQVKSVDACDYEQSSCVTQKQPFWSSMYNNVYSYFGGYRDPYATRQSYKSRNTIEYHSDSLEDARRNEPRNYNDYLYSDYSHAPIPSTDGHYLTLGQFDDARGTIEADCTSDGMWLNGNANGLVPYGQYSIWPHDYDYRSQTRPIDTYDNDYSQHYTYQMGINHTFQASQWGDADFSFFIPNGHSFLQGGDCNNWEGDDLRFSGMYQPYNSHSYDQADYIEQFEFEI
jgi:hypothetical protein